MVVGNQAWHEGRRAFGLVRARALAVGGHSFDAGRIRVTNCIPKLEALQHHRLPLSGDLCPKQGGRRKGEGEGTNKQEAIQNDTRRSLLSASDTSQRSGVVGSVWCSLVLGRGVLDHRARGQWLPQLLTESRSMGMATSFVEAKEGLRLAISDCLRPARSRGDDRCFWCGGLSRLPLCRWRSSRRRRANCRRRTLRSVRARRCRCRTPS